MLINMTCPMVQELHGERCEKNEKKHIFIKKARCDLGWRDGGRDEMIQEGSRGEKKQQQGAATAV